MPKRKKKKKIDEVEEEEEMLNTSRQVGVNLHLTTSVFGSFGAETAENLNVSYNKKGMSGECLTVSTNKVINIPTNSAESFQGKDWLKSISEMEAKLKNRFLNAKARRSIIQQLSVLKRTDEKVEEEEEKSNVNNECKNYETAAAEGFQVNDQGNLITDLEAKLNRRGLGAKAKRVLIRKISILKRDEEKLRGEGKNREVVMLEEQMKQTQSSKRTRQSTESQAELSKMILIDTAAKKRNEEVGVFNACGRHEMTEKDVSQGAIHKLAHDVKDFVRLTDTDDLRDLLGGEWINNFIIDAYLHNLQVCLNLKTKFCYADMFLWAMNDTDLQQQNIVHFIRGSIAESSYLFFPIHQSSSEILAANHFTLFSYHFQAKCGIFYDSMGGKMPAHIRKRLEYLLNRLQLDSCVTEATPGSCNAQTDVVNCGIHVLHMITRIVQQQTVMERNFDPFRYRWYIHEVITGMSTTGIQAIQPPTFDGAETEMEVLQEDESIQTIAEAQTSKQTTREHFKPGCGKTKEKLVASRKRCGQKTKLKDGPKKMKLNDKEVKRLKKQLADARKTLKYMKLRANETKEQYQVRINTAREKQNRIKYLLRPGRFLQATQRTSDSDWFRVKFSKNCPHCGAIKSTREAPALCCQLGKVRLEPYPSLPSPLYELMMEPQYPLRYSFMKDIRRYNANFALACMRDSKYKPEYLRHGNKGGSLRIVGKIQHQYYSLLPKAGCRPIYGQLYYLDTEAALQQRKQIMGSRLSEPLLRTLETLLRNHNPHIQAHIKMAEMERREEELAKQENRKTVNLAMRLIVPEHKKGLDSKVYALPTKEQIAIIYKPGIDNSPEHPGFTVYARTGRSYKEYNLTCISPFVDPFVYPILFPKGTFGYQPFHENRTGDGTRKRISMREYYAYRLFERDDESRNYHLHGHALTEQFFIDACVRNDANRFEYYKKHQADLSKEKAKVAVQAVKQEQELMPNARKGMAFFMPSNFQGSYEFIRQRQIHMMTTFHYLGKPDLFITFTCNQKWPELMQRIRPDLGETAYSRPDVTIRVMHEKMDQFVKLVKDEEVLGPVSAMHCVVEFQKRGLPHVHCLVVLDRQHKLEAAEDVDQIITAEIPDLEEDPEFYENVKKFQIHGPCGEFGTYDQCQIEDEKQGAGAYRCKAKFPMPYSNETVIIPNHYPRYRRRNNGRTVTTKSGIVDNRFVVPTNRYLSLSMNCHVNVEDCFNLKCAANYLAKYLCKPMDKACVEFYEMQRRKILENRRRQPGNKNLHDYKILDERRDIEFIQEVRFISAMESVQELFGFPLQKMSTVPYVLPVHDENEQNIYFHCDGNENQEIMRKASHETQLTAYFKAVNGNKLGKSLTYVEFPRWYAWNRRKKQWNCRYKEDEKVISRLQEVNPRSKLFYLRTLLLHRVGVSSFQDLRTVNGVCYEEYIDACNALGLFDDNKEWENCLEQAAPLKRPYQLRHLFVTMLTFCRVHDPTDLFNKYKDALSRDFREQKNRYRLAYSKIVLALKKLNKIPEDIGLKFQINGKSKEDESLTGQLDALELTEHYGNSDDEMFADMQECEKIAQQAMAQLNPDQRRIFDTVMLAIQQRDFSNLQLFRIVGSGGTGKTFLLNTLIRHCRSLAIYPVVAASTGTAATLLVSGRTAHSAFGIPLQLGESSTSVINRNCSRADVLRNATLLIIDEITMLNKFALNLVDRLLRDLATGNASNLPFGGRTVILGGDFKQLLPVVVGGYRGEVVSQAVFNSDLFDLFTPLELQLNMRSGKAHIEYAKWLLDLGKGLLNDERNRVALPDEIVADSMQELLDFTFDGFRTELSDDEMSCRAILSPRNVDTSNLNEIILQCIYPSQRIETYFSHDEPLETENPEKTDLIDDLPIECYYNANPSGFPPHALRVKVGLTVLLLRNLNVDEGLVNGTRLCITACYPNLIETRVITGASKGTMLFLCRLEFETPYNGTELGLRFKRLQFPIKPGSAMTINKAQGQTFTKVGLNLQQQVFSHGQLYVAFSRVSGFDNVRVFTGGIKDLDGKTRVRNIVYPEVLERTEL